jgi:hypothetical protein
MSSRTSHPTPVDSSIDPADEPLITPVSQTSDEPRATIRVRSAAGRRLRRSPSSRSGLTVLSAAPSPAKPEPVPAGYVLSKRPISWRVCQDLNALLLRDFVLCRMNLRLLSGAIAVAGLLSREPVLFALALVTWVVGSAALRLPGLNFLGGELTITLQNHGLLLTAEKGDSLRAISVPRELVPRLDSKGLGDVDLCWAAPNPVRFPIGGLRRAELAVFEVWRSGHVGPGLNSRIDVKAAPSQPICPLCHDQIGEARSREGRCSDCETLYHSACWSELGGCALPSCRPFRVPRGSHPVSATHLVRRRPDSRCA